MLTGSRTVAGARILTPQPLVRVLLGYCFLIMARIFFGWPLFDRINGFKMFRREAAWDIFRRQYDNTFLGEAEIVFIAEKRGWKVKELPILWTDYRGSQVRALRDSGRSFFGIFKILWRQHQGLYTQDPRVTVPAPVQQEIKKKIKRILVTGGLGFIGSNFIRHIYTTHPETVITNLDLLTYAGNMANLKDITELESKRDDQAKRYHFVQGDVCDEVLVERVFSENLFDLVVHFAAESHVDRSILSAAHFVRTNIEGTRVLIEAARRHGVQCFIHISTDEIYGSIKDGYASEEWLLQPSNPYSASKAGADLLVQAYIRTHDFPAIIIRGSNNYGPYQYPEKLIPLAITNLLENKKIPVHGYGVQIRSWLHVQDFCRAIDTIAFGNAQHNIYNVAGEEKTNHEVLELIAQGLGKDLQAYRMHVNDRPGADGRYAVDASRLEKEFSWSHHYSPLADNIGSVIQWYAGNQQWWRDIKSKEGFLNHYDRQFKGQWC